MSEKLRSRDNARKGMIVVLSVAAISIVAEAVCASSVSDDLFAAQEQLIVSKRPPLALDDASIRAKRTELSEKFLPDVSHKSDKIQMAQFTPRPDLADGPPPGVIGRPPFPFGLPGTPEPSAPNFDPGAACIEDMSRQMAGYAYTRGKLQLNDNQKAAWKPIEDALDSSIGKLRAFCEALPREIAGPPGIIERSDFEERQLALRLDLVRALKAPLQQLIGQLTPEQRAALDRPPSLPSF
jgi:hypothetical protein